jgi:membrane protein YdbS with pleckstrin-like domain
MEYQNDFQNDQVFLAELPAAEKLNLSPLHPKYLTLMYMGAIGNLLLPLGWIIASFIFDFWQEPLLGFGVLFLVLLFPAIGIILVKWSFNVKGYALRERDVVYQSGLLFRNLTVVPFSRVQHCEIHRGVLSRLMGLSQVNVYTAGGSGSDLTIPGLSESDAERICSFILRQVNPAADEEE